MIKINVTELPEKDGDVKLFVRHLCNNKLCFEPEHLVLGTQYENDYDDKILNGTLQRGETHYNSSITQEVAQAIKLSKPIKGEPGYQTQKERAKKFNVTLQIVKRIDCGKSWANLENADGETSSKRKIKAREFRKNAKEREWTEDMWTEAKKRVIERSEMQSENNEFMNSPCRLWKSTMSSGGYGVITIYGRSIPAHVLSCSIKNMFHRPDELVTRHLCGNKLCVNEEHLEFGTQSENAIDVFIHGKILKFTPEQILDIRDSYEKDGDHIKISKLYDVNPQYIKSIVEREIWKHIT